MLADWTFTEQAGNECKTKAAECRGQCHTSSECLNAEGTLQTNLQKAARQHRVRFLQDRKLSRARWAQHACHAQAPRWGFCHPCHSFRERTTAQEGVAQMISVQC